MKKTTPPRKGRLLLLAGLLLALCTSACQKDDDHTVQPDPPAARSGHPTAVGTPAGDAVTKEIGPDGGTLATADGKISVQIPGGALATAQTIGIQPITSTNPSGKSKAYRLTPHGVKFNQPVNITFRFGAADLGRNLPEALGIAYQDDKGVWQSLGGPRLDKAAGTLTVATTHFSDWSIFERFWLDPWEARVDLKGSVVIHVMTSDLDLAAPLPEGKERALGEPAAVDSALIKHWRLQGEGMLVGAKNNRKYFAPDQMPATNPQAVSVELDLPQPGTFLLVSNITVGNPPHISYVQVDERTSKIYIYGSGFGQRGSSIPLMTIDGEPQTRIDTHSDNLLTYVIPHEGKGSSGPVVVTKDGVASNEHVLNQWNVTLVYNRPCAGKSNGNLYQKIYFRLVLRGDANPDVPEGEILIKPLLSDMNLCKASRATYEAGGQGKTSYTLEDCGTDIVSYSHVTGELPHHLNGNNDGYGFSGRLKLALRGFELQLNAEGRKLIPAHYTYLGCGGDSKSERYMDLLSFDDFSDDKIEFSFEGSTIKGGRLAEVTSPAPNLHWDNPEVGPSPWKESLADATLTWAETSAKYPDGVIIR